MDRQSEIPMDMSRIQQLAQSLAGKKLIAMLQQYGGIELQTAVENAVGGDYSQAKAVLQRILDNPEANVLLRQMQEE